MSNFENMSLVEMTAARDELNGLIEEKRREEQESLVDHFREMAKAAGYDFEKLVNQKGKKKKTGGKVAAKYRHPDNPELTWTGRGRKPSWLSYEIEQGKIQEDFAI